MEQLHGIFFTPPIEASYIDKQIKEIFTDHIYDSYLKKVEDPIVLDVGGNIGLSAYNFSRFAKKVYVLEPDPQHFKTLSHMIEFNKLTSVTPFNMALSNIDGTADFYQMANKTMNSLTPAQGIAITGKVQVPTIRLDTFFKQENIDHIDIMKLDVEGEEYAIVGGDGFANVADKIDVIIGEYHAWGEVRNIQQFKDSFENNGFTYKSLPGEAHLFVATKL